MLVPHNLGLPDSIVCLVVVNPEIPVPTIEEAPLVPLRKIFVALQEYIIRPYSHLAIPGSPSLAGMRM